MSNLLANLINFSYLSKLDRNLNFEYNIYSGREVMTMENQLSFKDEKSALEVARRLIQENYVVMLSREEELVILNFEWVPDANRNGMVFISRETFEELYM